MSFTYFGEIEIEIDIEDVVANERVIEFRDHERWPQEAFLAIVIPDGGDWSDAAISVNPRVGDLPVELLLWATDVARNKFSGMA